MTIALSALYFQVRQPIDRNSLREKSSRSFANEEKYLHRIIVSWRPAIWTLADSQSILEVYCHNEQTLYDILSYMYVAGHATAK
jgi:hypothetical protein